MTDPTGGVPNPPQAPLPPQGSYTPPPAGAPTPPPAGGNWNAPPPGGAAPGGFNPNFQQASVEAGPAPGVAYADIVTRIIALVIDSIILWIPYMIVATILAGMFILSGGAMYTIIGLVIGVLYAALAGAYFVWTWTTQRASYGQKFLKLETVNAADGATLTRDQAIKRFIYLYAGNLLSIVGNQVFGLGLGSLLALVGLGYIVYLLYTTSQSPKRQGFHDVQAGTVVVKHL
jgi:uncharacterized RDD family membrane protein YckC